MLYLLDCSRRPAHLAMVHQRSHFPELEGFLFANQLPAADGVCDIT
jgi:hypothetical protein